MSLSEIIDSTTGTGMFKTPIKEIHSKYVGLTPRDIYILWANEIGVDPTTKDVYPSNSDDSATIYNIPFSPGNELSPVIGISTEGCIHLYKKYAPTATTADSKHVTIPSTLSDMGNITRQYFPSNITPSMSFYGATSRSDNNVDEILNATTNNACICYINTRSRSGGSRVAIVLRLNSDGSAEFYSQKLNGTSAYSGIMTFENKNNINNIVATDKGTDLYSIDDSELHGLVMTLYQYTVLTGVISDELGNPIQSRVTALLQDDMRNHVSTFSGTDGVYTINVSLNKFYTIVCEDIRFNPLQSVVKSGIIRNDDNINPSINFIFKAGTSTGNYVAEGFVYGADGSPVSQTVVITSISVEPVVLGIGYSDVGDGSYTVNVGDYNGQVMAYTYQEYGTTFEFANKESTPGKVIHPSTPNGYVYKIIEGGVLPDVEPELWPVDLQVFNIGTATAIPMKLLEPQMAGWFNTISKP